MMPATQFTNEAKQFLIEAGYKSANVVSNCAFTLRDCDGRLASSRIDLAAFYRHPHDMHSACVVAFDGEVADVAKTLFDVRYLSAPVAIVSRQDRVELWPVKKNVAEQPIDVVDRRDWPERFASRLADLSPDIISQAKQDRIQLDFVDSGLSLWSRNITSQSLKTLLEALIKEALSKLSSRHRRVKKAHDDVLRLIFHLFACRALQDKGVVDGANGNAETALTLAHDRFSENVNPNVVNSPYFDKSLADDVFQMLKEAFSFSTLTTEILAHAYENALVTQTLRKQLGIYYTPSSLTEYILKRLPIESIDQDSRVLYDPCCGCGSFLLAGFNRFSSLLPDSWTPAKRHEYLRKRLMGSDIDAFARELASLSLVLTDLHNKDGWTIFDIDVASLDTAQLHRRPSIIVTNPPFREIKLGVGERREFSAEVLKRLIDVLEPGGLLGIVLPQSILESGAGEDARRKVVDKCEVLEIAMLAGGLFASNAETAVMLLRKPSDENRTTVATIRELRSLDLPSFNRTAAFTRTYSADIQAWALDDHCRFIASPLADLWNRLASECAPLEDVAAVRNGLQVKTSDDSSVSTKRRNNDDVKYIDRLDVLRPYALLIETKLRPHKWIKYGPQLHRAREQQIFLVPKVLINSNRNPGSAWRLVGAPCREELYFSDNFHAIIPLGPNATIEQIVAVLNSPIANAWFDAHCRKRKIVQRILEQLPFPSFDAMQSRSLSEAVHLLEAATVAKWKQEEEGMFYDGLIPPADTVELLHEIDEMVYDAYGLSPHERRQVDKLMAIEKRPT